MKNAARLPIFVLVLVLVLVFCRGLAQAQLVMGQYEDEAPAGTWNSFGGPGAAAWGLAGTEFTLALDATAVFSNPGLLTRLPRFSVTVSGSTASSEFYRYGPINTGIVSTPENVSLAAYALDSAALAVRLGGWALGVGYGLQESYGRPVTEGALTGYSFHYDQSGKMDVLNLSLARSLGSRLSLGIGLNLVRGDLNRLTSDTFGGGYEVISSSVSQKYSGMFVSGGLLLGLTDSLRLAAVIRLPYTKKSKSQSTISRQIRVGATIAIESSSEDEYQEPLAAGVGLSYNLSPDWRVACDLTYFNWSKYKVAYFSEPLARDFRDIVRGSLGMEYVLHLAFRGSKLSLPLRAGLALDPQPMKNPHSTYFDYSLGAGLHGKVIFLDMALLAGRESGSGRSLAVRRGILSVGLTL